MATPEIQEQETEEAAGLVARAAHALELPLALTALAMVLLVIIQITGQVGPAWQARIAIIQTALWAVFVVHFALRLYLAPRKLQFVKSHPFDALVVALPFLALLRVAMLVPALRLAPMMRVLVLGGAGVNAPLTLLRRRRLGQLLLISALVILIGASLGFLAERGARGTEFHTFGDALWWSATLIATYGSNVNPVTGGGRLLGYVLMLYGVGVFSYITASIASVLVGLDRQRQDQQEAADLARMTHAELQQLRAVVEQALLPTEHDTG